MIQQLHMNGTQNGKKANGEFQILSRGLGLAAGMVVCQHNSAGVVSQNMFHQSALIHSGQVDAAAAYGVGLQDLALPSRVTKYTCSVVLSRNRLAK